MLLPFVGRWRIVGPLTQHEYREAACARTHEILPIRGPVCPKKVFVVHMSFWMDCNVDTSAHSSSVEDMEQQETIAAL